MARIRRKTVGTVCILGAGSLWGLMSIFVGGMNKLGLEAMEIVSVRLWLSVAVLAIIMLASDKKKFKFNIKDIWCFLGTGVISLTLFNYCYFTNIEYSTPGIAAMLLYTSPVFIMFLSMFVFHEKMTLEKLVACAMTFLGCALALGVFRPQGKIENWKMVLTIGVLSGLGYALYSIFGRFATNKGYDSMTISFYSFLFGAIGSIPFTDFSKIMSLTHAPDTEEVLFFTLGSVAITVIPYLLYTFGLQFVQTGKAGILATVEVVVATLVGVALGRDNSFNYFNLLGIILVVLAPVVMNVKRDSKQKTSRSSASSESSHHHHHHHHHSGSGEHHHHHEGEHHHSSGEVKEIVPDGEAESKEIKEIIIE